MKVRCPLCGGKGCDHCVDGWVESTETVWGYLQDADIKKHHFNPGTYYTYYGSFLERLGRRLLRDVLTDDFYANLYPDTVIMSSQSITSANWFNAFTSWVKVKPDYTKVLHIKKGDGYEKHAVIFEIKSGISPIQKHHVEQWRDMITNPGAYIKKCNSIRVMVMWIYGLDEAPRNMFYSLKEVKLEEIPNNFKKDD